MFAVGAAETAAAAAPSGDTIAEEPEAEAAAEAAVSSFSPRL